MNPKEKDALFITRSILHSLYTQTRRFQIETSPFQIKVYYIRLEMYCCLLKLNGFRLWMSRLILFDTDAFLLTVYNEQK